VLYVEDAMRIKRKWILLFLSLSIVLSSLLVTFGCGGGGSSDADNGQPAEQTDHLTWNLGNWNEADWK
jgi:hypothetical protein